VVVGKSGNQSFVMAKLGDVLGFLQARPSEREMSCALRWPRVPHPRSPGS
jgi:hypothetical protein